MPISKWQAEAEFIANQQGSNNMTLGELQGMWKKLFKKAIVAVNNSDKDIEWYIDMLLNNYFVSSKLYNEIVAHCLQFKKKTLLSPFQKMVA